MPQSRSATADAASRSLLRETGASAGEAPSATLSRPADVRLHFGGFFLRIIAGKERRDRARVRQDRKDHPVFTLRNLALILVLWTLSSATALFFLGRALQFIAEHGSGA